MLVLVQVHPPQGPVILSHPGLLSCPGPLSSTLHQSFLIQNADGECDPGRSVQALHSKAREISLEVVMTLTKRTVIFAGICFMKGERHWRPFHLKQWL